MNKFILLTLLLCFSAAASEVYRWVDENGQVHYSDTPIEGAEQVILPKAQTFKSSQTARRAGGDESKPEQIAEKYYQRLLITSPTQEEALWNIEGILKVTIEMSPRLMPGHRLKLIYDDQPLENIIFTQGSVQMTAVHRGTHTLVAEVIDANGRRLIRTNPRIFHVRQTSIANPVNPITRPRPTP